MRGDQTYKTPNPIFHSLVPFFHSFEPPNEKSQNTFQLLSSVAVSTDPPMPTVAISVSLWLMSFQVLSSISLAVLMWALEHYWKTGSHLEL